MNFCCELGNDWEMNDSEYEHISQMELGNHLTKSKFGEILEVLLDFLRIINYLIMGF